MKNDLERSISNDQDRNASLNNPTIGYNIEQNQNEIESLKIEIKLFCKENEKVIQEIKTECRRFNACLNENNIKNEELTQFALTLLSIIQWSEPTIKLQALSVEGMREIPKDIYLNVIFPQLAPQEIITFAQINKWMYDCFGAYRHFLLNSSMSQIDTYSLYRMNFPSLFKGKIFKIPCEESAQASLDTNGYFLVPNGLTISIDMPEDACLMTKSDLIPHADLLKPLYQNLFKREMDENEIDNCIHHLWAVWPFSVYISKDNKADRLHRFLETNKDKITNWIQKELTQSSYFSFHFPISDKDNTLLTKIAHKMVITHAQLGQGNNKEVLGNIFETNPLHQLLLSVGDDAKDDKIAIMIEYEHIFRSLKKLKIINPFKNIFEIKGNFLKGCWQLTTIDLSSLAKVTSIADRFLYGCTGLTTADLSPFTKITWIGACVLYGCTGLTTVDLSPFTNVTTIGNGFLLGCTSLTPETQKQVEKLKESHRIIQQ